MSARESLSAGSSEGYLYLSLRPKRKTICLFWKTHAGMSCCAWCFLDSPTTYPHLSPRSRLVTGSTLTTRLVAVYSCRGSSAIPNPVSRRQLLPGQIVKVVHYSWRHDWSVPIYALPKQIDHCHVVIMPPSSYLGHQTKQHRMKHR